MSKHRGQPIESRPGALRRRARALAPTLALLAAAPLLAAGEGGMPVPVSPGGTDRATTAAGSCPTFSWGGAAAGRYELAVVRLDDANDGESATVLREEIPGGASSWTPPADRCFAAGRYFWSVRVLGEPEGPWPRGRAFTVRPQPSEEEVTQALELLERYRASVSRGASAAPENPSADGQSERRAEGLGSAPPAPSSTAGNPAQGGGFTAAITGTQIAVSGEAHGVAGSTGSPLGAGLYAANSAPNAFDLVLDGASDGTGDAFISQRELDLRSASPQVFTMRNGGGGAFTLQVAGTVEADFAGDGSGLTAVPVGAHTHAGADIESGTVGDPFIASTLARDGEVFGLVTAGDGAGSGLDADLLDGLSSASFLSAATDNWVDEAGDAMTGNLSTTGDFLWSAARTFYATIPGSAFQPSNNTDINLGRQWFKLQNYISVFGAAVFPNTTSFVARIDLPDGASIQSITIHGYDNAAGADATFSLFPFRRLLNGTTIEGIMLGGGGFALPTAGSSASIQTASQVPLGSRGIIDNLNYAYDMALSYTLPTATSGDIRFYGVQIAYTLNGPG